MICSRFKEIQKQDKATIKANTGILRCAQNDKQNGKDNDKDSDSASQNDDSWRLASLAGGLLDGVEDAYVAGAAAEVSGETFLDLGQCRVRVFVE